MPRESRGPRLWLKPGWVDETGSPRSAVWIIKDGRRRKSTGLPAGQREEAERALAEYVLETRNKIRPGNRHPSEVLVDDVLNIYLTDKAPGHARPQETVGRVLALSAFFSGSTLADINGTLCRAYAAHRGSLPAARRELEDLRAAINHHRREGLCSEIVGVVLPEKSLPRERWLTRSEAARLIWAAWRYREVQKGKETDRRTRRHVARFILVALYTGTRAGAVCSASFEPIRGAGYIDVDRGVFYRRPQGERETKKRRTPVRLPPRLIAHLRRWKAMRQTYAVEWNGQPVKRVSKAFRHVVTDAKLDDDVTPHVLRHTAATWLMQSGVDLWDAAHFLAMTMETLETTYGHHHPDYQAAAAMAISGGGRGTTGGPFEDRLSGTKRAQSDRSDPNVVEIARKISPD